MAFEWKRFLISILIENQFHVIICSEIQLGEISVETKDVCNLEAVNIECSRNEVVLLKSATYGRMRIGRCISDKEINALGPHFGTDPRYLGCSADVLSVLDQKCSGKSDCEIRLSDIPEENFQPCFPGLKMYIELSYSCINIVDAQRSCAVVASKTPNNIMISFDDHRYCGSDVQPWVITAATGQRIALRLLELGLSDSNRKEEYEANRCQGFGVIREKISKRNTTICFEGQKRERDLYSSFGNKLEIVLNALDLKSASVKTSRVILELQAIGCSDIIPPEDTWLKRKDDRLIVGCYSNRQMWHLSCDHGNWAGVIGNCTASALSQIQSVSDAEVQPALSDKAQVLSIVAISGFTLAICLTIVCIGAIYLHRFYGCSRAKEYSTLNCGINSTKSKLFQQGIDSQSIRFPIADEFQATQQVPTYSVYVGETHDPSAQMNQPT